MEKITLYRYERPDGGITVSLNEPDGEYQTSYRLIADDGMVLTDAEGNMALVVDTDTPDEWREIENPEEEPEVEPEDEPEIEPTAEEILDTLLGVTENE